jgi:putative glutathione S-transferase
VLWDKQTGTIVNNESREVMRMLDTAFDELAREEATLAPNGVYRAGFAHSQRAYEQACRDVFATLERCEERLRTQRYMCGDRLTEADLAMFTTSLRFDLVYYAHFKCNVRRLAELPNVWGFVRDLYQMPAVRRTCRLDHIKTHYYWSQDTVNPTRIVPLGPSLDLDAPHDRARLSA